MKEMIRSFFDRNRALAPVSLTTLRLLLGPVAVWCAWRHQPRLGFLAILLVGLLSDIYDGVVARRLGVSTPAIRRYDSLTDVVFYLFIAGAAWLLEPDLIVRAWPWVAGLLVSEVACIGASLLRFRCLPATHSWLAKVYGLVLFATFVGVLCAGGPAWLVTVLGIVGLTANVEIMVILFVSKQAPVDVLSLARVRAYA